MAARGEEDEEIEAEEEETVRPTTYHLKLKLGGKKKSARHSCIR
jgi:hypothetical protein